MSFEPRGTRTSPSDGNAHALRPSCAVGCARRRAFGWTRNPVGLALVLGVLALACDRNIEPYQPGEEARPPDLARIFPGPPADASDAGGEGAAGGRAATESARAAFPPSRTEGAGGNASAGGAAGSSPEATNTSGAQPIAGRVELPAELASGAPQDAVLFVIARPQGAAGGPPLAVVRIEGPSFPVEFEIGPANVMIPTMRFAGPIALMARLDADGNAMTRGETDLASPPVESLAPGATGVALVLGSQN